MTTKSCTDYWLDRETMSFVGDFEGMYRDVPDPWGCESEADSLNNIIFLEMLFDKQRYDSILDIGCGLGHFTERLYRRNGGGRVCGSDISETAVDKARLRYPRLDFRIMNVLREGIPERYGLVVLSEVLWYVLDDLAGVFGRIKDALAADGCLGIKQYFPDDQRFGRDVLPGVPGFENFIRESGLFIQEATVSCRGENGDGTVLLARLRKAIVDQG